MRRSTFRSTVGIGSRRGSTTAGRPPGLPRAASAPLSSSDGTRTGAAGVRSRRTPLAIGGRRDQTRLAPTQCSAHPRDSVGLGADPAPGNLLLSPLTRSVHKTLWQPRVAAPDGRRCRGRADAVAPCRWPLNECSTRRATHRKRDEGLPRSMRELRPVVGTRSGPRPSYAALLADPVGVEAVGYVLGELDRAAREPAGAAIGSRLTAGREPGDPVRGGREDRRAAGDLVPLV